jgi:PPOX class probable F420-dependent enzyme
MTELERLAGYEYVSLTTFRKDGTPVATPVWAVRDGQSLAVWTPTDSWKVKRIRRNPEVTVAPCTVRGKLTGDPVPGRAEIMSAEETKRLRGLIGQKYGIKGRLAIWASLKRRGSDGTIGLRVMV